MRTFTNTNTANNVVGLNGPMNVSVTCDVRVSGDTHRPSHALTLLRVFARGAKAATSEQERKSALSMACCGMIQKLSYRINAQLGLLESSLRGSALAWQPAGLRSPAFAIAS